MSAPDRAATGKFVWYDFMSENVSASEEFYCSVIGWTPEDVSRPGNPYRLFRNAEGQAAGLMPIPEEARRSGVKPAWMGYIGVADVDDATNRVAAAGGQIHRGASEIEGIGRFSVVSDPLGAGFILFKGYDSEGPPRAPMGTPGYVGWHELRSTDPERSFAFYASLFGWIRGEAYDMSEMGAYQLLCEADRPGIPFGGLMKRPADSTMPDWLYYIGVDSVEAALSRMTLAGGAPSFGPHQVPNGEWAGQGLDNSGTAFAIVSKFR